jgi:hypothetical protein
MGWLEGLLTGYQKRHYDIEADKRREAELAAVREGRAFETLLNSKYPDIKHLAAAGILDAANPRKKKGGFAGWMGEMSTSPYLPAIQRYQEMLGPEGEEDLQPPAPAPQQQAIPTPPPPTGAAAMPATAQTQAGSPALTPTQPLQPTSPLQPNPPTWPTAQKLFYSNLGGAPPEAAPASATPVATPEGPSSEPPPIFPGLQGVRYGGGGTPSVSPQQGPILAPLAPGQTQPQLAPGAAGGPPAPPGAAAGAAAPGAAQAAGAAGMTAMPAGTQPAAGLPQPGASATAPPPAPPGAPVAGPPPQLGALPPGPRPITTLSTAPPPRPRRTTLTPTVLPGGRSVFPSLADIKEQATMAEVTGDVKGWQEIRRLSGDPNWEQQGIQDALQQKLGRGAAVPYRSMELEYVDQNGQIQRTLGFVDQAQGRYLDENLQPIPAENITKALPASALGQGVWVNRAMAQLHVTPLQMRNDPAVAIQVNNLAMQLQQQAAYSTGTGAGLARYDAPQTLAQAALSRTPVGSRSSDYGGRIIPTGAQADRRLMTGQMLTWLDEIDTKFSVLPRAGELGAYAPGAAIAFYRAHPDYREAYAELDSSINQILASLSRVVQENKGTQTEKDAERAMDTLAQVQGRLMNPLLGDTQESARARLGVTKEYLRQIIATLPVVPLPNPSRPAGAAGAGPSAGAGAAGAGAVAGAGGAADQPPPYAPVPLPEFWVDDKTTPPTRWYKGKRI